MKGNIYGVDIKLMPPEDKPLPITIEINGSNYGTDFFRYEEGFSYYEKFARVLGAQAKGKPIFIQGYPREIEEDILIKKINKYKAKIDGVRERESLEYISKFFGISFQIDTSWLADSVDFKTSKIDNPSYDPEDSYHQAAAKNENIPLIVFDEINYGENNLEFKLMDGSSRTFDPDEIGLIKSSYELFLAPGKYKHLFLSSEFLEGITDNKSLAELVDQLSEGNEYLSIVSFTFGLGIDSREKFLKYSKKFPLDLFVKKPSGQSGGIGVEFLRKKEVMEFLNKITYSKLHENELLDSISSLIFMSDLGLHLESYLSVIEPFVLSVPVLNKKTGENHDACARTVVYSPPDSDPIVLGSQWRLSPSPVTDEESSLENRFRANLSRGAIAAPIDSDYEKIVNEHAIGYVKQFETTLWQLQNRKHLIPAVKEKLKSLYNAEDYEITDSMAFRHMFWWLNMLDKAENLGIEKEKFSKEVVDRIIDRSPWLIKEIIKEPVLIL